jgi:hypothetical protein
MTAETITGRVDDKNERGIRIGEDWFNRSQFSPVDLPETGAHVRLKVDGKGCIKELELLDVGPIPAALSSKDERITRLAVLKATAHFLGLMSQTRDEVRSEHALVLADRGSPG